MDRASCGDRYYPELVRSPATAYPQTEPVQVGALEQIQNRLVDTMTRIQANTTHLHGVADRVFGAMPENASKVADTPAPHTALDTINATLNQLERLAGHLASATDRLSKL